ncbi:MAG: endonuclease III domain-containing protein [Bacillota bacterium]
MKLSREALVEIHDKLQRAYGALQQGSLPLLTQVDRSPMDVLIATILSQNTTDRSALKCFLRMKREVSSWSELAELPLTEVAQLIKECGLSTQKARNIKEIVASTGGCLDHLATMHPEQAFSYLLSMPGVGPKTAACVMLFSLGKPYFPVDTHVRRVVTRLGLAPTGSSAQKVQQLLQGTVPAQIAGTLHLLLITHGRACCTARSPQCKECCLSTDCDYVLSFRSLDSGLPRADESTASLTGSMSGEAAMSRPQ